MLKRPQQDRSVKGRQAGSCRQALESTCLLLFPDLKTFVPKNMWAL